MQFLEMVIKVYLKIPLIVLFYVIVFDNFILVEELFAKALRSFEICVLVNSNLYGKLCSLLESPITSENKISKVTLVLFFILILIY